MTNANYCKECNETLTLHADGSIACGCGELAANSNAIPTSWVLTQEELSEARTEEKRYQESE